MRILFTIFIAVIAFAAGVWYMGGFESVPATQPTTTPIPAAPSAIYDNADADMIQITSPLPGATLPTTFTLAGKARGGWYFEASFPYQVLDANGMKIAEGPVQATGDWMTPEFVPFTLKISIPNYKGKATLILKNDNPSGLPENDASVSIPIVIQ
ncbi:MAG: Gmad2 immunoglobulin-like domain-containing protein [Minisyncoccia bacterium]